MALAPWLRSLTATQWYLLLAHVILAMGMGSVYFYLMFVVSNYAARLQGTAQGSLQSPSRQYRTWKWAFAVLIVAAIGIPEMFMIRIMLNPIGFHENATAIETFEHVFGNIFSYFLAFQIPVPLFVLYMLLRPTVFLRDRLIGIPLSTGLNWSDIARAHVKRDARDNLMLELLPSRQLSFHSGEIRIFFDRDQAQVADRLISKYGESVIEPESATSLSAP